MKIADQERVSGVHEIAGPQANARIVEYLRSTTLGSAMAGSDETPWCQAFVNWVLKQAGIATLNSASAAAWANWGIGLTQPRYGAVTVIHSAPKKSISGMTHSGNHVGFLVSETATHYELLGGNQSDSVKISQFNKGHWSLKGISLAALSGRRAGRRSGLRAVRRRPSVPPSLARPQRLGSLGLREILGLRRRAILLRKVGGFYTFIHRMLLEYLAARYDESSVEATPNAEPSQSAIGM